MRNVIRVEETSSHKIEEEDVMRYGVKNGELVIQSGRNGKTFLNWGRSYRIDVKVMVPKSFAGVLDIQTISGELSAETINATRALFSTTSGNISVAGGMCDNLSLDSTSGRIDATDIQAEKASADTMSGEITLKGTFGYIEGDSTSGSVKIEAANVQEVSTTPPADRLKSYVSTRTCSKKSTQILFPAACGSFYLMRRASN